jgi:hypothetical protein
VTYCLFHQSFARREAAPIVLFRWHLVPGRLLQIEKRQREFLSKQKGFIKRDLARVADGQWADVIYWESRESVEQTMQNAPENPAASGISS